FVCENNLYMEYTSIYDVTAVEHPAADRASAYGLEPVLIDGNDVDVVYRTATAATRAPTRANIAPTTKCRHGSRKIRSRCTANACCNSASAKRRSRRS